MIKKIKSIAKRVLAITLAAATVFLCNPIEARAAAMNVMKVDKENWLNDFEPYNHANCYLYFYVGHKYEFAITYTDEILNECQFDGFEWVSDDTSVATITNDGKLTPVSAGETHLHFYYTKNGKRVRESERQHIQVIDDETKKGQVLVQLILMDGVLDMYVDKGTSAADVSAKALKHNPSGYVFIGWDREITDATEDAVYYARYEKINDYTPSEDFGGTSESSSEDSSDEPSAEEMEEAKWDDTTEKIANEIAEKMNVTDSSRTTFANIEMNSTSVPTSFLNTIANQSVCVGLKYDNDVTAILTGRNGSTKENEYLDIDSRDVNEYQASKLRESNINPENAKFIKIRSNNDDLYKNITFMTQYPNAEGKEVVLYIETALGYVEYDSETIGANGIAMMRIPQLNTNCVMVVR